MNNPEGGSVSSSINTIVGGKDVDLSGGGTNWKKRNAKFWIVDVSNEGFILAYEIHIEHGATNIERKSKKEIRFDTSNYTIDLSEGFNFTIDLEVASENN